MRENRETDTARQAQRPAPLLRSLMAIVAVVAALRAPRWRERDDVSKKTVATLLPIRANCQMKIFPNMCHLYC